MTSCSDSNGRLLAVGDKITLSDRFGTREAVITGLREDGGALAISNWQPGIVDYQTPGGSTGSVLSGRVSKVMP